jgi:AcrR family transcriptional regulator
MGVSRRRRSRAEIVEANDEALRNAAVQVTHEVGWDSVTFSGVARVAGLSVGAVYGRAETQAELGIDLWVSRVRDWLTG